MENETYGGGNGVHGGRRSGHLRSGIDAGGEEGKERKGGEDGGLHADGFC